MGRKSAGSPPRGTVLIGLRVSDEETEDLQPSRAHYVASVLTSPGNGPVVS